MTPDPAAQDGQTPVRLLLAEDQVMIREALAALLSFEGDMEIVAQVGRGDEVLKAAQDTHPDVAVLDIEMPGLDGLAAAAELKKILPGTKIVILTTFGRPGFLRRAMESGVSAFLVKDSPADKLTQTIRRVLAGELVIDPDLAAAALADGRTAGPSPRSPASCTCPRGRCGTTCPPASRRPVPATAPRRSASHPNAAGSRP
jgi:two-component system response regulator DesR